MTSPATLNLHSWMRTGLAVDLVAPAIGGAPTGGTVAVDVSVVVGDGTPGGDVATVRQQVTLRGPGDVVGLLASQVVRADPPAGTRNAEPNYFVSVELATPDLPWMFTPAAPDADDRLVPWLALVVVRDDGTQRIAVQEGAPLPVLSIVDATELPELTEAWAWAHVQSTVDVSAGTSLAEAYAAAPESWRARLMSTRRLDPETSYLAAIVPTFEAGRRAGLGLPPADPPRDGADWWQAWTPATTAVDLPVYHWWSFRTGAAGNFESLVRKLRPRELDAGIRPLDIGDAGTGALPPSPPALKPVSWKGALVSPAARDVPRDDTHWDAFRAAMRPLLSGVLTPPAPPSGARYDPLVHDPVVGPPAYGAVPAGLDSVPEPVDHDETTSRRHEPVWFGELNLDPVHRSVAGLGSEVVRRDQESLMASAWRQADALAEINRVLNWSSLAVAVGERQATKLRALTDASLLQVTAPAALRLRLSAGQTVAGRLAETSLPTAVTSAAFRRICRPDGPVGRARRAVADAGTNPATALTRRYLSDLDGALACTAFVRPAGLQVGVETATAGTPVALDGGGSASSSAQARQSSRRRGTVADRVVADMPRAFGAGAAWTAVPDRVVAHPVGTVGVAGLSTVAAQIRPAIAPAATIAAKLASRVTAPGEPFANGTVPAQLTASPEFPDPLYERLRAIEPEFLLPGVGAIPDDTVGLAEVNSAFVEAFLVGANHELAREFLWREYPAAPGDTWLRTFWDSIPADGTDLTATVADIGPISGWLDPPYSPASPLGAHQIGHGSQGTLVLVIRGELFRRYPETVVYASKGVWNEARTDAAGDPVPANTLREEAVDENGAPSQCRQPLFIGALDATTVFLGFDLTVDEALGPVDAAGAPRPGGAGGDRDGGWFVVFEQPPAGPRFGLDVGRPAQAGGDVDRRPGFWRNASWYHLVDDPARLAELSHATATAGRLAGSRARPYDERGANTFQQAWGTDAAAMARITLRRPVRMLVHASAMLPALPADSASRASPELPSEPLDKTPSEPKGGRRR